MKTKKIIKKLLCVFLILTFIFSIPFPVYAVPKSNNLNISKTITSNNSKFLKYDCKAYILVDGTSGQTLLEKNSDEELPIASITKIMTMKILAQKIAENKISLQDKVKTSKHAFEMPPTKIFLDQGEELSVNDMLKSIALASANDATVAIAEHIAGSEEEFVKLMNEEAEKLNMKNTHFSDCCGLNDDNNYSSARDVAIMTRDLMIKYPWIISNYTSKYETQIETNRNGKHKIHNTNKLVHFYEPCTGVKTGKTDKAGYCLCSTATKNGMKLIAVCLGIPSSVYDGCRAREQNCKQLLEYGFNSFTVLKNELIPNKIEPVKILKGEKSYVDVEMDDYSPILVKKGSSKNVKMNLNLYKKEVKAPIKKGQVLGKIVYNLEGNKILERNIVASENVKGTNFIFLFCSIVKNFFAGINVK